MPELLLPSEDRLARWDPEADQLRVIGWRPGPAGVSALDLANGLRVVVDHASPTTLAEVAIDLVRGRIADDHLTLLSNLLGDDAVEVLRRMPGGRVDRRPVRLPSPRGYIDDLEYARRDRDRDRDGGAHASFARMVLAADLGDDAGLDDSWRPVALLEAASTAFDVHRSLALDLVRRGVGVLEEVGGPNDTKVAYQLASMLRTIAGQAGTDPVARDAASWARRLTRRADSRHSPATPAAMPAAMAEFSAAAMPLEARPMAARVHEQAAPPRPERALPVGGDHRGWASLDRGNNVAVIVPGLLPGAWARVFRTSDRLLLGLSPVRSVADRRSEAVVVIPPTAADDLHVDIVDDPSTPQRAPAHDQVRRAVTAGREAARLSRLRDHDAQRSWETCAAQWEDLGDTQRANLARQHGERGPNSAPRRRSAPTRPLLVDGLQ